MALVIRGLIIILAILLFLLVVVPVVFNVFGIAIFSPGGGGGRGGGTGAGLGGALLVYSPDGGAAWKASEFAGDKKTVLPSTILDIASDPADPVVMFAATLGGGLWKSTDAGAHWAAALDTGNALNPAADVYKIAISQTRPATMYLAVMQGGRGRVLKSEDRGVSFRQIYEVPQDRTPVFDLATPPGDAANVMIATGEGRLLESRDGGATWSIVRAFGEPVVILAPNPVFSAERYAITASGRISKTFDGGATWTTLPDVAGVTGGAVAGEIQHPFANWQLGFSSGAAPFSFALDPASPGTLYLTRGTELFVSDNGGFTWDKITTLITGTGTTLGGVATDPRNARVVFITAGSDVYKSTDRGHAWSIRELGTTRALKKIYISRQHPDTILIATGR